MLHFYYDPKYKYTNRDIIDIEGDLNYNEKDYVNIDSSDTINGHIIYRLATGEQFPSYIHDTSLNRRWFVSGITQLGSNKYQISLLRDIISENPDLWKNEESYIAAGTANNYNKYKRWDLPYTNTKIKQERLDFAGKSSFYVFYVNEQEISSDVITENDLEISGANTGGRHIDYTVDNLNEIPSYEFVDAGEFYRVDKIESESILKLKWPAPMFKMRKEQGDSASFESIDDEPKFIDFSNTTMSYGDLAVDRSGCKTIIGNAVDSAMTRVRSSIDEISSSNVDDLDAYVDKNIRDTDTNKLYTINRITEVVSDNIVLDSEETSITVQSIINTPFPFGSDITVTGNPITVKLEMTKYIYTLEEVADALKFDFNFVATSRKLPKSAVRCVNIVSGAYDSVNDRYINDNDITQCLMLAQTNGINPDNTVGRIIDVQYLPFSVASSANANIQINDVSMIAQFIENDDFMFSTNLYDLTDINKETDTIKIVSPSRASQMLFRPYDNDGNMEFTTKITLKPFASVIYVRPSTKGLLIKDFDDKDCLIINEDFSLTNVSSEWTNYIYNNRNYENVFNREIQGREFQRTWERKVEQANARSDEWNARSISAQKARTYTGNIPMISDISAAIGTAWADSAYMQAAAMDRQYNEAMYEEGLNQSRDLFRYQLDNIQSQPAIPSKITTIDCKFLDGIYLEFYSTNDTEKLAIKSYIKYNGNRIDDYGTFANYWGHFVRGKIIKTKNYTQPETDELNRRLQMGIYTEVKYD